MNVRDPIYDALLAPETMSDARTALIARYNWFLHRKLIADFATVRDNGLTPRDQEFYGYQPSDYERQRFGEKYREIVCLAPFGTTMNLHSERFCVAIKANDLPTNVAMDFSFPDVWTSAPLLKAGPPPLTDLAVFLKVVAEAGSVASYDPIPPGHLRIWVQGAPKDCPDKWPTIGEVDFADEWI
jgi:hypothetical protein